MSPRFYAENCGHNSPSSRFMYSLKLLRDLPEDYTYGLKCFPPFCNHVRLYCGEERQSNLQILPNKPLLVLQS